MGRPKKKTPAKKFEEIKLKGQGFDGDAPIFINPETGLVESTGESDEMSEEEAAKMVENHVQVKEVEKAKVETKVDTQQWTRADPVIPAGLSGVWVAVYKCPEGHKTKATNRQAKEGVNCCVCKEAGKDVKAHVMKQFESKPAPSQADEDEARRQKARKVVQ